MATAHKSRVLDMTQGDPFRLVLQFSMPLFCSNLLQQLYNLTDTALAGHLLGSASYPKGLQVTAFTLRYDASTDIFSVTLEIGDRSRQTLSQTSFEVKRINRTVT